MIELPVPLRPLDRKLRSVRFRPRASLEPEILRRISDGELPPRRRFLTSRLLATAALAVIAGATALKLPALFPGFALIEVDRCCFDLDGGGLADDGVLIRGQRDAKVHRLRVYEDQDGSANYTSGDIVRHDRGGTPAIPAEDIAGTVTTRRCCIDFDGGGPEDDGLLLIGVPPDRVLMAAIYETSSKSHAQLDKDGWLLR